MIKSIIASIEETHLIKFDRYDLIEVSGSDALEFLNNQFTNDLKMLSEDTSSFGAWCSIKGRVLYTFRIWRKNNLFQLLLPSVQTETFLKKLEMFIFRSNVTIELAQDQFIYGLFGKKSDQFISAQASPQKDNEILSDKEKTLIKIPSQLSRYLIITENEKITFDSLSVQPDQKQSINQWDLLNIDAGITEILPGTAELFLPQMLDLERLGGLSFQKGCYPGQEIVARVKYRGEVKKQLMLTNIQTAEMLVPGMSLILDAQLVGHVVNASLIENNHWAALSVINIKDANSSQITLEIDKTSSCSFDLDQI